MNEFDYLKKYIEVAPVSLAIVRANECKILLSKEFAHPMLDIGCGDGLFSRIFFLQAIEEGIDISQSAIDKAKKTGMYNNLQIADAGNLPFKENSFKTVFSNCVIEHIPHIEEVLKNVSEVLDYGGKFIFTVPSDIYGDNLFFTKMFMKLGLKGLAEKYSDKINSLSVHHNLWSPETWDCELKKAGMEMISCDRYLSPEATAIHDITFVFGAISLLNKKLFGRMIVFRRLRKYFIAPLLYRLLKKHYVGVSENGSSLVIVAEKKEVPS